MSRTRELINSELEAMGLDPKLPNGSMEITAAESVISRILDAGGKMRSVMYLRPFNESEYKQALDEWDAAAKEKR